MSGPERGQEPLERWDSRVFLSLKIDMAKRGVTEEHELLIRHVRELQRLRRHIPKVLIDYLLWRSESDRKPGRPPDPLNQRRDNRIANLIFSSIHDHGLTKPRAIKAAIKKLPTTVCLHFKELVDGGVDPETAALISAVDPPTPALISAVDPATAALISAKALGRSGWHQVKRRLEAGEQPAIAIQAVAAAWTMGTRDARRAYELHFG